MRWPVVAATLLAFLSPGAWLIVQLPPQPIAQALHLATVALWLVLLAWGAGGLQRPPRALLLAVGAVGVVSLASLALNRFPLQQLVYDVYAEMPAVLWLAYLVVFLVAASIPWGAAVRDALKGVVIAGAALVAVMVVWRWTAGFVTTFGSPAYSVPALAPLPFISLGLAVSFPRQRVLYRVLAAFVAAGLAYAAAGISAFFALGIGALVVLAVAPGLLGISGRFARPARVAGAALLVLACAGTLLAQVPAVGARVAGVEDPSTLEQSIATRLYLWDAAGRMTAERPVLGYGPAGYRFSAVEYYESGFFGFLAAIGSDPIAFSAPSPHSLLWDAATRLGLLGMLVLGALFVVWVRAVRGVGYATDGDRSLRLSVAIGFVAYLAALLVTLVHFASGLFGAVAAGFAVAAVPGARESLGSGRIRATMLFAAAGLVLAFGFWRMFGLTTGTVTGQGSPEEELARVDAASRIIPGEPLNERRRLELTIWTAQTPEELASARAAVDEAPGYITDFLPNLPHFAFLGLNRAQQMELDDFSWERELLERAAAGLPETPPLVAEQLHLAIAEGELEALPELIEQAEKYGMTYPLTADYILRANEALIP